MLITPISRTWAACMRARKWLSDGSGSLKEKTARGSVWLMTGSGVERVAGLAKISILGRLLTPADFGLLGIGLLYQRWIEAFTQTGINSALIQKRDDIRDYLDTAWSFQLLRSIVLAGLLFIAAPLGAAFFNNTEATPFIRSIGLLTLLHGFINPAIVYFRRELDFRRDTIWRTSGVVAGLVSGILAGLVLRNAWALVISLVTAKTVEVAGSYWFLSYRPRWRLDGARLRELLRFGKWIFWTNSLSFLEQNADGFVVGRWLGTGALGGYQMALNLAAFATTQIGTHAFGVLFPAFSRLKDVKEVRRAYLKSVRLLLAVIVPAGCFVMVFAEPVVRIALGPQWRWISPVLQILVWAGAAKAISGVITPVYFSLGKPGRGVLPQVLKLAFLAALVYPLSQRHGVQGVAAASAISSLIMLGAQIWAVHRIIGYGIRDMAASLGPSLLGSTPFLLAGLVIRPTMTLETCITAVAAFCVCLLVLWKVVWRELKFFS